MKSTPFHSSIQSSPPRRIDLHCHSDASNMAAEVMLNAIHCPECYSSPEEVFIQARRRGMDFITITDHDAICGVQKIADRENVLIGEELTCWFPEDHCKMHVLVYGITQQDHDSLQAAAKNIYEVAEYIERNNIAHAVAHPIYRQNDKLERWHLERLLLMFKGFECLNGAHSALHREAFEPLLNRLTRQEIHKLSERHSLLPRWPRPWFKARTGGSDDHGLLNIGRTWTEFPSETGTVDDILQCLREGTCRPGGEAGSSMKLAHTFYSVAVRYYGRHILSPLAKPNFATTLLQTIVGERPAPRKRDLAKLAIRHKLKRLGRRIIQPFGPKRSEQHEGTAILKRLFLTSARNRLDEYRDLQQVFQTGLPPLSEHAEMFRFVSSINRDVSQGIAAAINKSIDDASFTGLFDSISAALAQQFVLFPYYFAVFHQNKERHLLRQITGQHQCKDNQSLRVGLFTDTLDEINGVGRFIRDMGEQANRLGRSLTIHTSAPSPRFDLSNRKNFAPLLSRPLPYYSELQLNLPPVLEILEWADRQQFDLIHVSTPGPMGLCGWLAAKMLRVPLLGTYHTDFPAYVDNLTRDHRITNGTTAYMEWFYGQMAAVFSRSAAYRFNLHDLGIQEEKLRTILPGVATDKFAPRHRNEQCWSELGVKEPKRLLYCGRVSVEKNLPLLVDAFKQLCLKRGDTALIVAGDGPYLAEMRKALAGLPAYFPGYRNDAQLAPLYAGADLFVFPSRTDTLGQVVMEAQASGLPVIVSNEGGPKELTENGVSGVVIPAIDAFRWCATLDELLSDDLRRQQMSHAAAQRADKFSQIKTFESFWADHVRAAMPLDMEDLSRQSVIAKLSADSVTPA